MKFTDRRPAVGPVVVYSRCRVDNTVAYLTVGMYQPTSGALSFKGHNLFANGSKRPLALRQEIQQHPYTHRLLSSISVVSEEEERPRPAKVISTGEIPGPVQLSPALSLGDGGLQAHRPGDDRDQRRPYCSLSFFRRGWPT